MFNNGIHPLHLFTLQNASARSGKHKHCVLFPTTTQSWKRTMSSEAISTLTGVHNFKPSESLQSDAPTRRRFAFRAAGTPRPPLATRQANQVPSNNHKIFRTAQNVNEDVLVTEIAHPPFDTLGPPANLPHLVTPTNRSSEPLQNFNARKQPHSPLASSLPPPNPAPEGKERRRTFGNLDATHGAIHLTSNHAMPSNASALLAPPGPDFTSLTTPVAKVRPGLAGLGIVNEGNHDRNSLTALANRNPSLHHTLALAHIPIRELSRERHSTPSVYSQSLGVDPDGGDGVDEDGTISIKVFNAMLVTNKVKDRKLRTKVNADLLSIFVQELMMIPIGRGNSGTPSKYRSIRKE